jgi:hypothetical protein
MEGQTQTYPMGRKFWFSVWALGVPFASCTVALYLGKLSGESYVSFLQWTIPIALGVHHGANVAQKIGLARVVPDQGGE